VSSFSFRLDGVGQVVPYDIRNCLVFKREPQNKWMCLEAHWKFFGVWSQEDTINEEILSGTPSSKCFTLGCAKFFGENERDKDNQHKVELALLGFDFQATNRPLSPHDQPVVLWSNIGFGRYWFGVLPLHVRYLSDTGYYKELKASPTRDFPKIWRKANI
jgi:hypothetical protein